MPPRESPTHLGPLRLGWLDDDVSDSTVSIRAAMNRKALADARQRAALARRFGFTENQVLAVQHLARMGELTPC